MNDKPTDVLIHTRNPLSEQQFDAVAEQVKAIDGVLQFRRSSGQPNLIMVVYHAGRTRALSILNKLTRLGFEASLVGI